MTLEQRLAEVANAHQKNVLRKAFEDHKGTERVLFYLDGMKYGKFRVGDLARLLNVSISSVRRAIKQDNRITDTFLGTKKRGWYFFDFFPANDRTMHYKDFE